MVSYSMRKFLNVIVPCFALFGCSVVSVDSHDLTTETELQPFSRADMVSERHLFKVLLSHVDGTTSRKKIESIIGKELIPNQIRSPLGNGSLVSSYQAVHPYKNYSYWFSYSEILSKDVTSFNLVVHFSIFDDVAKVDGQCLSLRDVKRFSKRGGWEVGSTIVGWMEHGFRARKGKLLLEATAIGGIGERTLPDSEMAKWIQNNGENGCIHEMNIQQTN